MPQYKLLFKVFLVESVKTHREALYITQETMTKYLRISPRSYISLERGDNGFSATIRMFFVLIFSEEDAFRLCGDFRTMMEREEDSYVVA